jgi:hypothetical protein
MELMEVIFVVSKILVAIQRVFVLSFPEQYFAYLFPPVL